MACLNGGLESVPDHWLFTPAMSIAQKQSMDGSSTSISDHWKCSSWSIPDCGVVDPLLQFQSLGSGVALMVSIDSAWRSMQEKSNGNCD